MTALTDRLQEAPRQWLLDTIEHLSMIRRADAYTGPDWEGAAIQDQAARDLDALARGAGPQTGSRAMIRGVYIGGSLADLFSEAASLATRAASERISDRGGEFLHDRAVEHTPVDTGVLREQWIRSQSRDGDVLSASVANRSRIAHLVEYGTRPHEEAPKDERAELTPQAREPRSPPRQRGPSHDGEGGGGA